MCRYPATTVACATNELCGAGACKWSDASLSGLSVSQGSLAFSPSQTSYIVTVAAGVTSVAVTPTLPQPTRATVKVNGLSTSSGSPVNVFLVGGKADATIVVTTESGVYKTYTVALRPPTGLHAQAAYVKASNTGAGDEFGGAVAVSGDGNTFAIAARGEDSSASGINGSQTDNAKTNSGAVYVYTRSGTTWVQQAYLKASPSAASHSFGSSLALSFDGSTLVVGASGEGTGGAESGAAYVFVHTGTTWAQQAMLKANVIGLSELFGEGVSLSGDGHTLAVSAPANNTGGAGSGAVYLFARSGTTWTQTALLKASTPLEYDEFGTDLALSRDGLTLAVSAPWESGKVFLFAKSGSLWSQVQDVKPSTAPVGVGFGVGLALTSDGSTLAVGAYGEAGGGAAYVFAKSGGVWLQSARLSASNAGSGDSFGFAVGLSSDGTTLVVSAPTEDSSATGINGNQNSEAASGSGAVYVFAKAGSGWSQTTYVKASNTGASDYFGATLALSGNGSTLVVATINEDSAATGINGNEADNTALTSGAAYVFVR